VIKFVSDLQQVGGFFRVLWFPPHNITEILLKVALNTIKQETATTIWLKHLDEKDEKYII
jgi:hypothetical protein